MFSRKKPRGYEQEDRVQAQGEGGHLPGEEKDPDPADALILGF